MIKKHKKSCIFVLAIAALCAVFAVCFLGVLPPAYAVEGEVSKNILVEPTDLFVQGGNAVESGKEPIYTLWTPLNVGHIRYGASEVASEMTPITAGAEDRNQIYRSESGISERGNRFFLRVKLTVNIKVLTYTSEDEANTFIAEFNILSDVFKRKIDGVAPRIVKNSLKPVLKENIWAIAFSVEEPSSDSQYFWAQSGIKSVKIVKKVRNSISAPPTFEQVGDFFWEYAGGDKFTKRENISLSLANIKGEYYVQLTDQVGNKRLAEVLRIDESMDQYSQYITNGVNYSADLDLNLGIRENVANTLDDFLAALNQNLTGAPFEAAYKKFLLALSAATIAYENGTVVQIKVLNEEYLAGELAVEFSANNYAGKVLLGDNLVLQISVASFDYNKYKYPQAASAAKLNSATQVLRLRVQMFYNGTEVPFAAPVQIYMPILKTYKNLSLVAMATTSPQKQDIQSGEEWVKFVVSEGGVYDFFIQEGSNSQLQLLWLLLLILPLGGAVLYLVLYSKKRKAQGKGAPKFKFGASKRGTDKDGEDKTRGLQPQADGTVQTDLSGSDKNNPSNEPNNPNNDLNNQNYDPSDPLKGNNKSNHNDKNTDNYIDVPARPREEPKKGAPQSTKTAQKNANSHAKSKNKAKGKKKR